MINSQAGVILLSKIRSQECKTLKEPIPRLHPLSSRCVLAGSSIPGPQRPSRTPAGSFPQSWAPRSDKKTSYPPPYKKLSIIAIWSCITGWFWPPNYASCIHTRDWLQLEAMKTTMLAASGQTSTAAPMTACSSHETAQQLYWMMQAANHRIVSLLPPIHSFKGLNYYFFLFLSLSCAFKHETPHQNPRWIFLQINFLLYENIRVKFNVLWENLSTSLIQ